MMSTHNNKLQKLCDAIFALNPNIRFAGVVNNMGTLVAGGMRQSVKSMEDKGDSSTPLLLIRTAYPLLQVLECH